MRLLIVVSILLVQCCTSFPGLKRPRDIANIKVPDDFGYTQLMRACLDNDIEEVQILIDSGAAVDQEFEKAGNTQVNAKGNTALFFAAQQGNDKIVSHLLSKGADINHLNRNSESALFQFSTAKVTEVLLNAGIEVNSGRSSVPIITALLARYKVDVNFEKSKILQLLINSSAEVDITVAIENGGYSKRYYPILYASSEEEVDILMNAGADINTVDADNQSLLYKLIDGLENNNKDSTTRTVLHMLNTYPWIDLEVKNRENGFTPLFNCIMQEIFLPSTCFGDPHGNDIGHALVAKGANVEFRPSSPQAKNCLLVAIQEQLFVAAKCLWLAFMDLDEKSGYSPIRYSFSLAPTNLIEELFLDSDPKSFGSVKEFDLINNPNKLNSRGQTAIFVATKFNYLEYLEEDIENAMAYHKANQVATFDLDIPYEHQGRKYTPLMVALDGNNELVAEWLIKWGANCKSAECIEKAVNTIRDPHDENKEIDWPFKLLFEPNLGLSARIPIDYISPDGESLLMMAAKCGNYPLITYYIKNVEHPIDVNTKTNEPLKEIVDDKTYRIISLKLKHFKKTLRIVPENHCGICLGDWEDRSKQGIPFWCPEKGHAFHYRCADEWGGGCPICSAPKKDRDDALDFLLSKNDIED